MRQPRVSICKQTVPPLSLFDVAAWLLTAWLKDTRALIIEQTYDVASAIIRTTVKNYLPIMSDGDKEQKSGHILLYVAVRQNPTLREIYTNNENSVTQCRWQN
jgi:hypothetical protein